MSHTVNVRIRSLALAAGLAVSMSAAVSANPAQDQRRAPRDATTTDTMRQVQPTPQSAVGQQAVLLIPASKAIGKNVETVSGEKLGDISDLLIGNRSGLIEYAVLSHGGVAGIGDTKIAVPFEAFGWNSQKQVLTLPMTKADIEKAPKLESDKYDRLMDDRTRSELQSHYRVQRQRAEIDTADRWSGRTASQWPLLKAKEIKGQDIRSSAGEEIGTVKELMFDVMTGRVAFLAVEVDDMNDAIVPVPWAMFDLNNDGKIYASNLNIERLRSAPRFESDEWRELVDRSFNTRAYQHYGRNAAWLERTGTESTRGPNDSVRGPNDGAYQEYDRMYSSGKAMQGSGLVMLVEQSKATNTVPQLTSVAVHTDDGKDVVIHLAPEAYLREKSAMPKAGDRIQFKGNWAEIDGTQYLLASEFTPANGQRVIIRGTDGSRVWSRR